MSVAVIGAGAFGTALAVALADRGVTLVAREGSGAAIAATRQSPRLPGVRLPDAVNVTGILPGDADILLLAVPAQALRGWLADHEGQLFGRALVACGKGIDLTTLKGPTALIAGVPGTVPAILTGPSFAAEIARGLPTALTLACADDGQAVTLQHALSTPALRLYRTTDTVGAELGGALKNVVAIACGAVMGAGLGHSARAALMTRGFAEMRRLATRLGAREETLAGLSGFGDLVLTCTSDQSRNYRYGEALGRALPFDPAITVEGAPTARAAARLALERGLDLPVTATVAALCEGGTSVAEAMHSLLNRPLKEE
ncbi:MAG: NAD(P)-dependent glycerol-3-phosphate dehydrogenase [Rubellimicrobium sp.]|nr:NAD(P)-dependent glycerol-3-phosphate dehydrogenase [Rubellimicrobium sp.]